MPISRDSVQKDARSYLWTHWATLHVLSTKPHPQGPVLAAPCIRVIELDGGKWDYLVSSHPGYSVMREEKHPERESCCQNQ